MNMSQKKSARTIRNKYFDLKIIISVLEKVLLWTASIMQKNFGRVINIFVY